MSKKLKKIGPDTVDIIPALIKVLFKDGYKATVALKPEQISSIVVQHEKTLSRDPAKLGETIKVFANAVTLLTAKQPAKEDGLRAFGEERLPAKSEIDRFSEYLRAVLNPKAVFKALKDFTASKAEIDVLKNVYSRQGAEIFQDVLKKVWGKPLAYQKKQWLSNVAGGSLLRHDNAQFITSIQQTFSQENAAVAQKKKAPTGIAELSMSDGTALGTRNRND